jgi:predicted  nucleic acid-binding Zn-ribbon protein
MTMTTKEDKIAALETEIDELTQERTQVFNQWVNTVKRKEREAEISGEESPELLEEAEKLLAKQRSISKKIMQLIDKIDSLSV